MKAAEEDGSVRSDKDGFQLLVSRGYEQRITAEGLTDAAGFDTLMATARRVRGGRGSNRILESSGDPIRLRPSRHGGILGRWLGDRFLSPGRPFREFRLWVELRRRGVALPTPVLAVSRRRGLLWQSAFGSLDREGAQDGADWLETQPDAVQLRTACIAFARTLRRLHDAGGLHGDLHLRNILIEDEDASFRLVLIDLDRTRIVQTTSARERLRELMRFARSLEKNDRADLISPRFRALVLSAYCAGDRSLRRSMLGWASVEAQRVRYHRLGWWIRKRLSGALFVAIMLSGLTCSIESLDQISDVLRCP